MTDHVEMISDAILHYRGDGPQQDDHEQMAWTIFEAIAVAGLAIVQKDEIERLKRIESVYGPNRVREATWL